MARCRHRVAEQFDGPPGHRLDRPRRLQDARHPVLDHLREAADAGGEHGAPQAIASSAARPNDSVCEGSRKRSVACKRSATVSIRPRNRTSSSTPRSRASRSASARSGPSPDHQQRGRQRACAPGRRSAPHRAPVSPHGSWRRGSGSCGPAGRETLAALGRRRPILLEVDEVRDHRGSAAGPRRRASVSSRR